MDAQRARHVLRVIRHRSVHTRVNIAGITDHPDEAFMMQMGRNLNDIDEGFLRDKRYLVMDRDAKYTPTFRALLERQGMEIIRLPPRSPNLNAFAERFV